MTRLPDAIEEYCGQPLTPPSVRLRDVLRRVWRRVVRAVTVAANWLASAAALVAGAGFALAAVGCWHLTT